MVITHYGNFIFQIRFFLFLKISFIIIFRLTLHQMRFFQRCYFFAGLIFIFAVALCFLFFICYSYFLLLIFYII
ncbi:hypothetical protein D4Q76_02565 [archaeon]|nr:MAG: hypothetical protein D4Q76_02565 [archaeon]